jgi:hypothetical protein
MLRARPSIRVTIDTSPLHKKSSMYALFVALSVYSGETVNALSILVAIHGYLRSTCLNTGV